MCVYKKVHVCAFVYTSIWLHVCTFVRTMCVSTLAYICAWRGVHVCKANRNELVMLSCLYRECMIVRRDCVCVHVTSVSVSAFVLVLGVGMSVWM